MASICNTMGATRVFPRWGEQENLVTNLHFRLFFTNGSRVFRIWDYLLKNTFNLLFNI
jgi:hypothetical protein